MSLIIFDSCDAMPRQEMMEISTDEQLQRLQKQVRQLQREKEHLESELLWQGKKLDEKVELLKQVVPKAEHERIIAELRREYESKLSEILANPPRIHNVHGAGRKRIATKEIAARILALREQGLSQAKITAKIAEEFNIKIKRTTVGEIVRGNYTPLDVE
jgi:sugar-specific transcriptional regulator TrmB